MCALLGVEVAQTWDDLRSIILSMVCTIALKHALRLERTLCWWIGSTSDAHGALVPSGQANAAAALTCLAFSSMLRPPSPAASRGCSVSTFTQKRSASRSLNPISAFGCRPKARGVSGGIVSSMYSVTCGYQGMVSDPAGCMEKFDFKRRTSAVAARTTFDWPVCSGCSGCLCSIFLLTLAMRRAANLACSIFVLPCKRWVWPITHRQASELF